MNKIQDQLTKISKLQQNRLSRLIGITIGAGVIIGLISLVIVRMDFNVKKPMTALVESLLKFLPLPGPEVKALVEKKLLDAGFQGVSVQFSGDGTVVLSGAARNSREAGQMEQLSLTIRGVQRVSNRLSVPDLKRLVESALAQQDYHNLSIQDLGNGVISLKGTTRRSQDAETIESIVASVPGVIKVVSDIKRVELAALVKGKLDPSFQDLGIREVEQGVIQVSGR